MIKTLAIVALTLIASGCATWTKQDTYRHAALTTLFAVDYAQTMKIAREPNRFEEKNPIIGSHPNEQEVTLYFAGTYALTTVTAMFIPPKYRRWFQYIVIGGQSVCILNNLYVGLGMGF